MTPSVMPEAARKPSSGFDLKLYGPFLALAALIVLGTIVNPVFLSPGNIGNVLTRTAFIGIIAVGATFVITAGGIDLSVGSLAAFASGVTIVVMNALVGSMGAGLPVILIGVLVALGLGLAAGLVNGLLVTKGRMEAFIVTLGTMGIFRSLVTYIADGGTLSLNSEIRTIYRPVYYGGVFGISYPILAFAVVALIGALIMYRTRFGRYCAAIGSSEDVARYSAINVDRVKLLAFVLQGVCVAIAVVIYVPRLGSASATTGLLWELEAIAAVIIGGTMLKGGYGRIWGTVVGAVMLTLIDNILNLTGAISVYLNGTIQGVIIIVAVLLQRGTVARR
ncbi:ABC transporter permease (plasmid) [Azospirillum argentinense]|uniref:ABC transporter permease n=1 Tax=Azospirillum argentinense TaxID=2970906 RepID=A0A060DQA7_9PROT|nr:ABC transporter permease [Azospirillum argentinense]AIB16046.1 ABC transporter permease [Azospirillum argentinense]EZQ03515.1 ABC transporter permease [Azospirillum argentinense]